MPENNELFDELDEFEEEIQEDKPHGGHKEVYDDEIIIDDIEDDFPDYLDEEVRDPATEVDNDILNLGSDLENNEEPNIFADSQKEKQVNKQKVIITEPLYMRLWYRVLNLTLSVAKYLGNVARSFLFGSSTPYDMKKEMAMGDLKKQSKEYQKQKQEERDAEEQETEREQEEKENTKNSQENEVIEKKEAQNNSRTTVEQVCELLQGMGICGLSVQDDTIIFKDEKENEVCCTLNDEKFTEKDIQHLASVIYVGQTQGRLSQKVVPEDALRSTVYACLSAYMVKESDSSKDAYKETAAQVPTYDNTSTVKFKKVPTYNDNKLDKVFVSLEYNGWEVARVEEKDLSKLISNPDEIESTFVKPLNEYYQEKINAEKCIHNTNYNVFFKVVGKNEVEVSMQTNATDRDPVGRFKLESRADMQKFSDQLIVCGAIPITDISPEAKGLAAESIASAIGFVVNPKMLSSYNALDNTFYEPLMDKYVNPATSHVNVQQKKNSFDFYLTEYKDGKFVTDKQICFMQPLSSLTDKGATYIAHQLQKTSFDISQSARENKETQLNEQTFRPMVNSTPSVFEEVVSEYTTNARTSGMMPYEPTLMVPDLSDLQITVTTEEDLEKEHQMEQEELQAQQMEKAINDILGDPINPDEIENSNQEEQAVEEGSLPPEMEAALIAQYGCIPEPLAPPINEEDYIPEEDYDDMCL